MLTVVVLVTRPIPTTIHPLQTLDSASNSHSMETVSSDKLHEQQRRYLSSPSEHQIQNGSR